MAETLTGGPPDRRWQLPRRAVIAGVGLVAVLGAAWSVLPLDRSALGGEQPHAASTAPPSTPSTAPAGPTCRSRAASPPDPAAARGQRVAALALSEPTFGATMDRWDSTAGAGPWTVVVRRRGGSLGHHSAVVTYPVPALTTGRAVQVGEARGRIVGRDLVWPIAGQHARVRGDLGPAALVSLAAATQVRGGRPVVQPRADYLLAGSGSYRPSHVREIRYASDRGTDDAFSGLVYTGVTDLGGFEDQLQATGSTACGAVHGQPAVASTVGGGNATLAWEVGPGLVGYVGYSGGGGDHDEALQALLSLASQSTRMNSQQWEQTRPQVVSQRNDP